MVTCVICKNEFNHDNSNKSEKFFKKKCDKCNEFWSKRAAGFKQAWAATVVKDARRRAIKKNVPFDIDTDYIYSILPSSGKCPFLDVDFKLPHRGVPEHRSITLDRIVPSKGYVKGNLRFVSKLANDIMSSASDDELRTFFKNYFEKSVY